MIGPGAAIVPPFPLPPYAHAPGRNPRHDPAIFAAAKAAAPAQTRSEDADRNQAWRYGLALLARGYFWECHEVLETVWMNAAPNSGERRITQAVIQIANGALKQRMGRDRAARRLGDIALGLIDDLPASTNTMGMEPADLRPLASALAEGLSISV